MRRILPGLAVLAACGAAPAARVAVPAAAPAPAVAADPGRPWRYDVTASAGGRELAIDAVILAREGAELGVEGAERFLSGVELSTGGPFQPLAAGRDAAGEAVFRLPPCPLDGCRVRYRFALAEAARRVGELHCALEANGAFVTSPSAWLMHPAECHGALPFELHVTSSPGVGFVTGLLPAAGGAVDLPPSTYAADVSDLPNPAWAAVGPMRLLRVDVEGEALDVAVLPGPLDLGDDDLRAWIGDAARAVRDHYGLTPIRRVQLVIIPGSGRGIGYARALGNGGATIVVPLGEHTPAAALTGGWELIHELLHVAFPKLQRDQSWVEEGMATYVEPLIRARRGNLSVEETFARFHQRMPLGLPGRGDGGLDGTHSWGRIYWGGAIFWLLADVGIRERTRGRRSLDDALRAILAQGGNIAERWDLEQVLAVGDEATGVPVLRELYAKLGSAAVEVDLDGLWRRLGVVPKGGTVTFDEGAELAWVRRGMVAKGGSALP
jgi:hypothetical protein